MCLDTQGLQQHKKYLYHIISDFLGAVTFNCNRIQKYTKLMQKNSWTVLIKKV